MVQKEIIRDGGTFESANAIYTIEHRRIKKYAEFRVAKRTPKTAPIPSNFPFQPLAYKDL